MVGEVYQDENNKSECVIQCPSMEKNTKRHTSDQNTVSTAVLEYNKGTNELHVVFNMLDIRDGYYFASSRKRRVDASSYANETSEIEEKTVQTRTGI